jgi:hypothetical protein
MRLTLNYYQSPLLWKTVSVDASWLIISTLCFSKLSDQLESVFNRFLVCYCLLCCSLRFPVAAGVALGVVLGRRLVLHFLLSKGNNKKIS